MTLVLSATERRLLPFVGLQGCVATLGGFAGVFAYAQGGMAATVRYAALMLGSAALSIALAYALGAVVRLRCATLLRAAFLVPAVLLWFADGRPDVLGLAFGLFLGLAWGGRHWLELGLLADAERDAYATHATVLTVGASLVTILVVTLLLQWGGERHAPVYGLYALTSLVAAVFAARGLPETPPIRLEAPWAVVTQKGFVACLPLFFLESGLFGVGQVLGASAAVHALGEASRYGWVATAATVAGGLALFALRRRRQSHNRGRWMGWACAGVALAFGLLGASSVWPWLYVLHLLLQSGVAPFWQASEQVLNQRTMDIHGALADRIVARELTLGVFRLVVLAAFGFGTAGWSDLRVLQLGAALMAAAAVAEYALGRAWLRHAAAPAAALPQRH